MLAEIDLAPQAVKALAAKYGRVECYPISCMKIVDCAADGFNNTSGLMPHYDWRKPPARAAVVSMHVAAANPAGPDAYQQFIRGRLGSGQVHNVELLILGK